MWTYKRITITVLIVLIACWILFKPAAILGILTKVYTVFKPFIVGACIAFVMNVLLVLIEKKWDVIFENTPVEAKKKLKRGICLLLSFIAVSAIITLLVVIIIPEMRETIEVLKTDLPAYVDAAESFSNKVLRYLNNRGINVEGGKINFEMIKERLAQSMNIKDGNLLDSAIVATTSLASTLVNAILAIAFAIFILADKENLSRQFKKLFFAMMPQEKYDRFIEFCTLSNSAFTNFITGQLTEACIIGCLCFIGMTILRMPYSGAISILVGFTALIPIVGAFLGTALGAFMILFVKPIQALWFVIFIIILQQFEGNLIYPKVVGKSVGLPGIWVLMAVAVGGSLGGVVGMIVAVPLASVVYELLRRYANMPKKDVKLGTEE